MLGSLAMVLENVENWFGMLDNLYSSKFKKPFQALWKGFFLRGDIRMQSIIRSAVRPMGARALAAKPPAPR